MQLHAVLGNRGFEYVTLRDSTVAEAVDSLFDPISGLFLASDMLEIVRYLCRSMHFIPIDVS